MRALAVLEPAVGEGATTANGSTDWDETVCWVADWWTEMDGCTGRPTYVKHKLMHKDYKQRVQCSKSYNKEKWPSQYKIDYYHSWNWMLQKMSKCMPDFQLQNPFHKIAELKQVIWQVPKLYMLLH
jgi:hypothetical protein